MATKRTTKKKASKKTPAAAAPAPSSEPPPMRHNRIPDATIRELELLLEHAKDARGAFTDAIKAQALQYDLNKSGLGRYIAARVADKLKELNAELDTIEQLGLFGVDSENSIVRGLRDGTVTIEPDVVVVDKDTGEVLAEPPAPAVPNNDPTPVVDMDADCPTCGLPGGIDVSAGESCEDAACPYMAGEPATGAPPAEPDDEGPRTIDGKKPISDEVLAAMPVVAKPLTGGGSDRGPAAERLGDDVDPQDLMSDESVVADG